MRLPYFCFNFVLCTGWTWAPMTCFVTGILQFHIFQLGAYTHSVSLCAQALIWCSSVHATRPWLSQSDLPLGLQIYNWKILDILLPDDARVMVSSAMGLKVGSSGRHWFCQPHMRNPTQKKKKKKKKKTALSWSHLQHAFLHAQTAWWYTHLADHGYSGISLVGSPGKSWRSVQGDNNIEQISISFRS